MHISQKNIIIVFIFCMVSFIYPIYINSEDLLSYVVFYFFSLVSILGMLSFRDKNDLLIYALRLFSVLYICSFVVKLIFIKQNEFLYQQIIFGGVGSFDFSEESYIKVALISIVGFLGIFTGLHLKIPKFRKQNILIFDGRCKLLTNRFHFFVIICFLIIYLFDLTLWRLGYGQMGIDKELPYKLGGLIYYLRTFIFPLLSFSLLDIAINFESKKKFLLIFSAIVLGAIINSFASLSRGALIGTVLPAIMFMIYDSKSSKLSQNITKKLIIFSIIILGIIILPVITELRYIVWGNENVTFNTISGSFSNLSSSISQVSSLFIARATGIQELMATYSASLRLEFNIGLFLKSLFDLRFLTDFVNREIFGSVFYSYSAAASPGLFGLMYISGNIIIVLVGSLICSQWVYQLGNYFYRKGFSASGYFVITILALEIWGAGLVQALTGTFVLIVFWFIYCRLIIPIFIKVLR